MTMAYVDHFTYALGRQKCSVEESVAARRTLTGASDLQDAGFRHHHVCDHDESAYDVALAAVQNIARGEVADVDAIVYATCIPANGNIGDVAAFGDTGDVKHLMDFPASRLQADLGLDRAFVVGVNQQACTSAFGAIRLANGLLAAEPDLENVLCLTADRFPPGATYEQAYSLISDGAAACIVSRSPSAYQILAAHQITNGGLVHADDDETVGVYFSYTARLIGELLAKSGRTTADVDWVVPQNTNVKAWQILTRLLGIDYDRVSHESLPDVGHMISGDNLVNLAYLGERNVVQPGDVVLLVMAGYGMNWQALLLERT